MGKFFKQTMIFLRENCTKPRLAILAGLSISLLFLCIVLIAHVIEFALHHAKACLDVAQALSIRQLGEGHAQELAPT